jgi:trans-aconitate methyltransferase
MLTSAASIINKSRPDLSKRVTWIEQSIDKFQAPTGGADVIFSNAALQWLPNHDTLFPRLMSQLRSGGALAVQMPSNWGQPSHTLLYDTCQEGTRTPTCMPHVIGLLSSSCFFCCY